MVRPALGALLLLAAGASAAPPPAPAPVPHTAAPVSRLTIRQRIILRFTARQPAAPPVQAWREKKGPRCMALSAIAGAAVVGPAAVDFILDGGTRLRARLERSCPALDFYSGFYLAPTGDGQICVGRDELRDRTGGACEIDRFRTLVADPAPPAKPAPPGHGG